GLEGGDLPRRVGLAFLLLALGALALSLSRAPLLHHVGELVGEELAAGGAAGLVLAAVEEDVGAGGEGAGGERAVEGLGLPAGVDADVAEVGAHRLLEERAGGRIQGMPGAAGPLDRALDLGGDRAALGAHGGALEQALDVAVAVAPLELQEEVAGR